MAKKQHIYGRKKSGFLKAVIGITILTGLATGILSVSLVLTNINVYTSENQIEQINDNVAQLQSELTDIKSQEDEYKNQKEELKQQLAQYQPIVIPDSMK